MAIVASLMSCECQCGDMTTLPLRCLPAILFSALCKVVRSLGSSAMMTNLTLTPHQPSAGVASVMKKDEGPLPGVLMPVLAHGPPANRLWGELSARGVPVEIRYASLMDCSLAVGSSSCDSNAAPIHVVMERRLAESGSTRVGYARWERSISGEQELSVVVNGPSLTGLLMGRDASPKAAIFQPSCCNVAKR